MVFYFTATGNSLYVARQFSEAPVSIPQIMRGSQRRFSDSTIGIVCPVFAGQPPKMVVRFLEESEFETEYFYMILTYGHDESDSPEFTARLAEKHGVFVDYIAAIKMVDNYLPVFDMTEETALNKHIEKQMEAAVKGGTAFQRQQNQITVKENCGFCLACVHNCPQKAIGLDMADKNPEARYRNEHISL